MFREGKSASRQKGDSFVFVLCYEWGRRVLVFSVFFQKVSVDSGLRVKITYIKKSLVVANEICFLLRCFSFMWDKTGDEWGKGDLNARR